MHDIHESYAFHVIFIRVYVISGLNYAILLSVKIYEVYVHYFVLDLENLVAGMETRRNRFNAEMKVCYNNSLMIGKLIVN